MSGAQLMPSQVFPKPLLLGAHWPACCLPACPSRHPYLNPTASLARGRMLIIIVAITILHTGLPAACLPAPHHIVIAYAPASLSQGLSSIQETRPREIWA